MTARLVWLGCASTLGQGIEAGRDYLVELLGPGGCPPVAAIPTAPLALLGLTVSGVRPEARPDGCHVFATVRAPVSAPPLGSLLRVPVPGFAVVQVTDVATGKKLLPDLTAPSQPPPGATTTPTSQPPAAATTGVSALVVVGTIVLVGVAVVAASSS